MRMPNPGYPEPRGVWITTASGFRLRANSRFLDVITDRGVPTPRFVVFLDGTQEQMANTEVVEITADFWPPGTILMFAQKGDAVDNADKIVTRSRRAGQTNIGVDRMIDPTSTRIEPR